MMRIIPGIELGLRTFMKSPSNIPSLVQLAITTKCNMSCKMCQRKNIKITNQNMPFEKVKKIIDRLQGVSKIALVGMGEPFLHPDLFNIIKYCIDKKIFTQVTTNGTLLIPENIEKVFESGLQNLTISLESINGNSIFGHNDFSVINNIKNIIEYKNKYNSKRPYLTLQIVLLSEVMNEIPEIIQWAKINGINHINLSRANIITEPQLKRPSREEEIVFFKKLKMLRKKHKIRVDCVQDQIYPGFMGKCYQWLLSFINLDNWCLKWSYCIYVQEDGSITPCFHPSHKNYGNILEKNLKEIWNGKEFQNLRKSRALLEPCIACDNLRINHRNPEILFK